ncbi:YlqD family protein [Niallia sp. XMNu-256]|uniref:YlqD family protein n=1 Tax=Niallia sp. XMNu-256 TaxID=3082444 RepID=UPI0030D1C023
MKLLQSVSVIHVLTEKSKTDLQEKYHTSLRQMEKECEQLQFQRKKFEKAKKYGQDDLAKFDKEIQTRLDKVKNLEFQLEQLHMLPLGSEIKGQEVQTLINVQEGDRWSEITQDKAIVIKDDLIIEIR